MSKLKLIREAIEHSKSLEIEIKPGAVFDWTYQQEWPRPRYDKELPAACNWFGAVLIKLGYTSLDKDAWAAVHDHLGTGSYWCYRFHMGFDQGRQLKRLVKEKGKKPYWVDEPTSKEGLRLRKEVLR